MHKKYHINFAKYAKTYLIIAITSIIICLGAYFIKGLDFGIDFTGGTIINIELHTKADTDAARSITDKYDKKAEVTTAGEEKTQLVIRTGVNLTDSQRQSLFKEFQNKYNLENKDLLSIDKVSASVGSELRTLAVKACIIAVVCMLIYITFRFEFLQGVCAIVALAHDLTVVIGTFAIFNIQVNSSFIAAVLTILGYSINDTIITFDRVRENTPKFPKGEYKEILNTSTNQTLRRSVNTSLTTLLAIIPLLIFGTASIREFVFPMSIGIFVGTFSSVCIASPLWYLIKEKQFKKTLSEKAMVQGKTTYSVEVANEELNEEELLELKEEQRLKRKERKEKKKKRKPKGQR